MRSLVNSVTHWDVVFLNRIFRLEGRRFFSKVVPWISHSADGYAYPLLPLIVYLLRPEQAAGFFGAALLAFALELPLYKVLKNWIKRDRPFETVEGVENRIIPSDRFSFPSGHTAAAVVITVIVSHFFPPLLLPAATWALLVGFSRVCLGVHYPTDILAGAVLGSCCGFVGLAVFA
jgi:undecaprenyl-diphosphatase